MRRCYHLHDTILLAFQLNNVPFSCPPSRRYTSMLEVVSYSVMYWYMCQLDGGRCHRVVNTDCCRLSPSLRCLRCGSCRWHTSHLPSWPPVARMHRTRRSHISRPPEFNRARASSKFPPACGWHGVRNFEKYQRPSVAVDLFLVFHTSYITVYFVRVLFAIPPVSTVFVSRS